MKKLIMNYIGESDFGYPKYKDNDGIIWLDIDYGRGKTPNLYKASPDYEEPDYPIEDIYHDVEIIYQTKYERNPREHDYMMLSRYKMDCDYYLGNVNRNPRHLYFGNPNEHIYEMEKLYMSFKDDEKPEWLTWEDIQNYRKQMCEEV